jgi:hypothetical protein
VRCPALLLVAQLAASSAAGQSVSLPPGGIAALDQGIDFQSRYLAVRARIAGKSRGVVILATRIGATDSVVRAISALGGTVLARFDDVGYARVELALRDLDRLRTRPDVVAAQLDAYPTPWINEGTDPKGWDLARRVYARGDTTQHPLPPPPAGAYAAASPYVPTTTDMGLGALRRGDATLDGRGMTIGIHELSTIQFDHPALQRAIESNGTVVPKLRGIIDADAYTVDGPRDSTLFWPSFYHDDFYQPIRGTGMIDAGDGTLLLNGQSFRPPHPGRYEAGIYVRGGSPQNVGDDRTADTLAFGVIWDPTRNVAWVDTNRDRDFRNEAPLHDINREFSLGWLPGDTTGEGRGLPVPFVVTFDSGGHRLRIYEGTTKSSRHGTMTSSMAAATLLLGGRGGGAAPGARLVLVPAGRSISDEIEAIIRAAQDSRIDLVSSTAVGDVVPSLGESILPIILDRVVERYKKLIVVAGGNFGPALSSVHDLASGDRVIAVGAYASRATYRAHYGAELPASDWILGYSSPGPTVTGRLKPDLVAPALSIAAYSCGDSGADGRGMLYALPACYRVSAGTSAAAPAAAGAAAVLLEAARRAGLASDPAHLAWALRFGARFLPGFATHEQGHGLLDVGRAWVLLHRNVELPDIAVSAPVQTTLDRYLRVPGRGVGLFEREGWTAGQRGKRTITLTRTSGPATPVRYGIRWRGNDGTFAAPPSVSLPRGLPERVPIGIDPVTLGVHSAALELLDPRTGYPVRDILTCIVSSAQFRPDSAYTVHLTQRVAWPNGGSFYLNVPPAAGMLRLELRVRRGLYGMDVEDPAASEPPMGWAGGLKPLLFPQQVRYVGRGQHGVRLIPNPVPGVWQVVAQPPDPSDGADSLGNHAPGEVELVASIMAADAQSAERDSGSSASSMALHWTNRLAPLEGAIAVAELGSRYVVEGAAKSDVEGEIRDIVVDSGTTTLRLQATPTTAAAALDLYLFDCTSGKCYMWDVDRSTRTTKTHLVRYPHAGLWKVVIDPETLPGGTTGYTYTEVMTHPRYGRASTGVGPAAYGSRVRWSDSVTLVSSGDPPPIGRELVAVVDLLDQASEEAEREHALAVFAGVPYRPVVLGTTLIPLTGEARHEANGLGATRFLGHGLRLR